MSYSSGFLEKWNWKAGGAGQGSIMRKPPSAGWKILTENEMKL